jgi:hypothetical protein
VPLATEEAAHMSLTLKNRIGRATLVLGSAATHDFVLANAGQTAQAWGNHL